MEALESLQNALPVYVNVYIAIFRYAAPILALLILLEHLMGKTIHWEHLTDLWQQLCALF